MFGRKDAAHLPLLANEHLPFPDEPLRDEISDGENFSDYAPPPYVAPRGPGDGFRVAAADRAGGGAGRRSVAQGRAALRARGPAREKKARRKNVARQAREAEEIRAFRGQVDARLAAADACTRACPRARLSSWPRGSTASNTSACVRHAGGRCRLCVLAWSWTRKRCCQVKAPQSRIAAARWALVWMCVYLTFGDVASALVAEFAKATTSIDHSLAEVADQSQAPHSEKSIHSEKSSIPWLYIVNILGH
jgi:hypothetical protein